MSQSFAPYSNYLEGNSSSPSPSRHSRRHSSVNYEAYGSKYVSSWAMQQGGVSPPAPRLRSVALPEAGTDSPISPFELPEPLYGVPFIGRRSVSPTSSVSSISSGSSSASSISRRSSPSGFSDQETSSQSQRPRPILRSSVNSAPPASSKSSQVSQPCSKAFRRVRFNAFDEVKTYSTKLATTSMDNKKQGEEPVLKETHIRIVDAQEQVQPTLAPVNNVRVHRRRASAPANWQFDTGLGVWVDRC